MIFVDSNILIDVLAPGQRWRDWSQGQIERLGSDQTLVVDQIVLAELASGVPTLGEATAWLAQLGIEMRALDDVAAFAAGQAFRIYRRDQQDRTSMLSDFLIGGHAQALGATLLTRDRAVYECYFPKLPLITPETDNG